MKTNARPPIAAVPKDAPQRAALPPALGGKSEAPKAEGLDLLEGAQAFGLWILLERPPPNEEKSAGGIILPDAVRERPSWIVRSIGDKVTIPVKLGDHVAFDGTRVMEDAKSGHQWCFAMEGQIFGKLDPSKLVNRIITQKAPI